MRTDIVERAAKGGRFVFVRVRSEIRKAGRTYDLPIHPDFYQALGALPVDSLNLFSHETGGQPPRPYTTQKLDQLWARYLRPLGIVQTVYECSRHFIATEAANRGEDIGRIAGALGNTVQQCAKTYVRYRPDALLSVLAPRTGPGAAPSSGSGAPNA